MAEYHELNFVNLEKNEVVETIYIDDDFFYYLAELYPLESKLFKNIPVFYTSDLDFRGLKKFQIRKPLKKGIFLAGINILNNFSFEKLLLSVNKWIYIAENLDECILEELDYEFKKEELTNNFNKLSNALKNISSNNLEYILLWEGI